MLLEEVKLKHSLCLIKSKCLFILKLIFNINVIYQLNYFSKHANTAAFFKLTFNDDNIRNVFNRKI